MIFLLNAFFLAFLDLVIDDRRHPQGWQPSSRVYVPIGISMALFAVALGVLLFGKNSRKFIKFLAAGILILIGIFIMLLGILEGFL